MHVKSTMRREFCGLVWFFLFFLARFCIWIIDYMFRWLEWMKVLQISPMLSNNRICLMIRLCFSSLITEVLSFTFSLFLLFFFSLIDPFSFFFSWLLWMYLAGQPWIGSFNQPLRGVKHSTWEGGIRTPAFVFGGKNSAFPLLHQQSHNNTYDGILHIVDVFPTILKIAGVSTDKAIIPTDTDDAKRGKGFGAISFPSLILYFFSFLFFCRSYSFFFIIGERISRTGSEWMWWDRHQHQQKQHQ